MGLTYWGTFSCISLPSLLLFLSVNWSNIQLYWLSELSASWNRISYMPSFWIFVFLMWIGALSPVWSNSHQMNALLFPQVFLCWAWLWFKILQASFFMTYVLTSGWASMSFEVVQVFPLLCNYFTQYILKKDSYSETLSFPYHTEIPKVLLFGLLGFTCAILAPLILPILLIYFCLAYLVYRNQVNIFRQCIL